MITFENVTYTYPQKKEPALKNISLHLKEGEFILLVGQSGAGKSTLLRCINGLVPHFSGGTLQGSIRLNGLDTVQAAPQTLSRYVGFVFQDPEAQFVLDRVEDEIAFALENMAVPPQEMRIRVEETLDLLDLAPLRHRELSTLSGGERQRTAIAAALVLRPQLLILDEPTSQLDPKSAEDVLQALVRLNSDLGLTILLAEHRLERVLPFVDRILYLPTDDSGILYGLPAQILNQIELTPPLISLGKALQWKPLPLTIKAGRRFSRKWIEGKTVQPKIKSAVTKQDMPYVQVRKLVVRYDSQPVLRGVDMDIQPGEIVILMGRNGTGKSTLLKSIVGLIKPEQGNIQVAGRETAGRNVADISRQVGYLPQDPNTLLFADTVLEELLITLRNHGLLSKDEEQENLPLPPQKLLERLGLNDKANAYPRDLSVGERQRVALGAIMITQPGALLLDEPTRGLDYAAKKNLVRLLQEWRADGMAILVVTHDVELAAIAADRVIIMSQGEIIANGLPEEVLSSSPLFAPQTARLFPDTGWLTVDDVFDYCATG